MLPTIALFADRPVATGIGIAASGTRTALEATGLKVIACDLEEPEAWARAAKADLVLIHANPDRLSRTIETPRILIDAIEGRPAIGYWVWEAPGIPRAWLPWLGAVDGLWVPSRFVAGALGSRHDLPISVVAHPVAPPKPALSRDELGLPAGTFLFLFVFNARSNFTRKNPAGLIHAYRRAFPSETEGATLILKTVGMRANEAEALQGPIGGRRDIILLNRSVEAGEIASLIAACDCYVSLHRAEGFGLTVAEAMALGKPVICTGYSGVMDFAAADTAYLVNYKLGRIQMAHGVFPAGTILAEPDLDQAASLIRHVFHNRDEAKERGGRAAAAVISKLSPKAVGSRMKALIEAQLQSGRGAQV